MQIKYSFVYISEIKNYEEIVIHLEIQRIKEKIIAHGL